MLDQALLSEKLTIARIWFQRAQAGEFELAGEYAAKFEGLLTECEVHARRIETAVMPLAVPKADEPAPFSGPREPVYVPEEMRPQGYLKDMAQPSGSNVLEFIRGMARPKAVRT